MTNEISKSSQQVKAFNFGMNDCIDGKLPIPQRHTELFKGVENQKTIDGYYLGFSRAVDLTPEPALFDGFERHPLEQRQ